MKNFTLSLLFLTITFLSFNIQVNASIELPKEKSQKIQSLAIYPNPTQGEFKVQIENSNHQKVNITIYQYSVEF